MAELTAKGVSQRIAETIILDDISLTLRRGELIAVLGPNGAGKTSLLRAMLGLSQIDNGSVNLNGVACRKLSPIERARNVSYLPQRRPLAWPNNVYDIVALGRYAHGAALGRLGVADEAAVNHALEACMLTGLSRRSVDNLSGGELARVHFARTLAAEAPLLVADEPVAALDPRHQLRIAGLIRDFVDAGGGALVVLHDVSLAARIADHLVFMNNGRIVAQGSPRDTLSAELMHRIYGVNAHVRSDDHGIAIRIEGIS